MTNAVLSPDDLEPIKRLTRDIRDAQVTLSPREARYLVDLYYIIQEDRKRANNQVAALTRSEEPHLILSWVLDNAETLESDIQRVLDSWGRRYREARWARSICGIGPIISAGLVAHIDIEQAPTVGHIWRFAGLDPTVKWEKKHKRPWNAGLKVLCWKIGESFVKVQNNDNDIYGKVYVARRALEDERNAAGQFADQAQAALTAKNYSHDTEAYKAYSQGRLPDAHVYARAKRYAVKLFLSHYHHVAYVCRFGEPPPKPYVIALLGHADYVGPPGWPME